jgi:hypothetical protein
VNFKTKNLIQFFRNPAQKDPFSSTKKYQTNIKKKYEEDKILNVCLKNGRMWSTVVVTICLGVIYFQN